ncbi:MAG: YebC/PmpR family DNA-binding transcriptional regulator [Christensenellaceae bacterium]
MSGHSKWSTIKRKKEKTDAARGKIFTKIGRELAVAIKEGGGPDPNTNSRLRDCIAKAKMNNMPNENINRAIKKAAGEGENINYETIVYEGYAPGGVAVIAEALTDNKNRTAADVRHAFDKNGGSLGASGCVAWMFDTKGLITVENDGDIDEEALMMAALEAGAEDVSNAGDAFVVTTEVAALGEVREALEAAGYKLTSAELSRIPQNTVSPDPALYESIDRLLDMLEENDDIQNVYHNAEMQEEE